MEPNQENLNQPLNKPEEPNLDVGAGISNRETVLPPAESAPAVEKHPAPEHEEQETVTEDGQVYQMPEHDDPNAAAEIQAKRIAPLPEEEKLWQLKLLARDRGVDKAVAVVKKMNDPWLEDRLHDDLMDDTEFRRQLEALGKLEKL